MSFLLMTNLESDSADSAYVLKFLNTYAMLLKKEANSEKIQY